MASQMQANLPLFYNSLVPLQSGPHNDYRSRNTDKAPFFATTHAVPLTIDEFIFAQRHVPIVFSSGDNPVPLGLFGLNEGVNVFAEADGTLKENVYVPAYVRRYPFMLARLSTDAQELSLCFDPESGLVGQYEDGRPLFDGDKPSEVTSSILKFCEEFELSAQRSTAFVNELKEMDLLMEGEVAIQIENSEQPYIYRGFQMINEEKMRELRGDTLRKINQNGILPLIMAHLFSLPLVRDIFGRQMSAGKVQVLETAGNA
ncbi:MAG TPA: SapC family protein [Allosphingosinicella sp.]|jgi:hypothetical protein